MSKETEETEVFLTTWQFTLKLDSDHVCTSTSQRPEFVKKQQLAQQQQQARGNPNPANYQPPGFLQQQIIDVEKLKRLDELDNAESDWTKSDDTFDYNKKIARYLSQNLGD